jgi:DNA-binding transcriptional LysR family regulator
VVQATVALHEKSPNVTIKVIAGSRADAIRATTHHQVDLGLVHAPVADRDIEVEIIGESEIVAVVPLCHPFAKYDFVTPRDLDRQPLIGLDLGSPAGHLLRERFEAAGAAMHIVIEANSSTVAFAAASSGRSIALIDPWPSSIARNNKCRLVRFKPTVPQRIALLRSTFRPPSRIAELFAEELRLVIVKTAATSQFVRGLTTST